MTLFMLFRFTVFLALCTISAATAAEVYPLKRVVLADSESAVLAFRVDPASSQTVFVQNVSVLTGADFSRVIAPFLGKPIGTEVVNGLVDSITKYAKAHDRLIARVTVPNQNVADGTLRLIVTIGRFNQFAIRGNRWFSSKLLQEKLGIKPGDEVRLSVLENAINWANTNPFRRIKVIVNPLTDQPGKADLLVGVQELTPWRFAASIDNYGTEMLGQWHYTASLQAGNLWGLDHQASYQFVTTDAPQIYQAHAMNYRVPLPWRHFVEVSASYSRVNAEVRPGLFQHGQSESADFKYSIPVNSGTNPVELYGGLEFKRGNNDLEFAGTKYYPTSTDTVQFTLGGSVVHHDKRGGWLLAGSANLSPGNIGWRNNRKTYNAARTGASPQYAVWSLSMQRLLNLGHGWDLSSRMLAQAASTNLLGSEQLTIGGPTSVRGYRTNVYPGDEGFVFNNELLSPTITTSLQKIKKTLPSMDTRFVVFYDAAQVFLKRRTDDVLYKLSPLASAGIGLRMSIASTFSLNFDYGWQIAHTTFPVTTEHAYGHLKVVLAY